MILLPESDDVVWIDRIYVDKRLNFAADEVSVFTNAGEVASVSQWTKGPTATSTLLP